MPKLAQDQIEKRMRRVEEAAVRLFKARGFHGVGLRQIAAEAGVSLGNIYNYYKAKEQLFDSILQRLHAEFTAPGSPLGRFLLTCRFPSDLEGLARAVGEMAEQHTDYLTLIYVDLAEFGGRHVRPYYRGLAARFGEALEGRVETDQLASGVDPVMAFTMVYMQFFNFFIVERMIGAEGHLGLGEGEALKAMAAIFQRGLSKESS
ncbi:MAG: TetR/AcrR family transcriptional regulator [Planctomycetes bacterium]|nr:TetR/AcrR family transcriptional regulator [Planctomycetota bacterium]